MPAPSISKWLDYVYIYIYIYIYILIRLLNKQSSFPKFQTLVKHHCIDCVPWQQKSGGWHLGYFFEVLASLLKGTSFGIRLHSYLTSFGEPPKVVTQVNCFTAHGATWQREQDSPSPQPCCYSSYSGLFHAPWSDLSVCKTDDMSWRTCLGINKCNQVQSFLSDHNPLKQ